MLEENFTLDPAMKPHFPTESDLNRVLPGLGPGRQQEWLELSTHIQQVRHLVKQMDLNPADRQPIDDSLDRAQLFLKRDRPYTISVVGFARAGKSTLINALLGRNLVAFKPARPTTGTVITVRQLVVEDGNTPDEGAWIYYYTEDSLKQKVQDDLKTCGLEPIYTNSHTPNSIDISHTLDLIRAHVDDIQTSSRRRGIHETRLEILSSLEDLLSVAEQKMELLHTGKEYIPLNTTENIRKLQQYMDEESPLNKNTSDSTVLLPTRIIPLIREIECHIVPDPALPRAALADVPGHGALTGRHTQHLKEQLDLEKTAAIVLVMSPAAPELGARDLVNLMR